MRVWACTPVALYHFGEVINAYTNPRMFWANLQRDYSQADVAVYGQQIHEIIKIRTQDRPPVSLFDHLYLQEPRIVQTVEADGTSYEDYGEGDYLVKNVMPAVTGAKAIRNPTTLVARLVIKG